MSSWFLIKKYKPSFVEEVKRFGNIFGKSSPYELNLDEKKIEEGCGFFIWSWNDLKLFPDIDYLHDNGSDIHLIIDGFVSDFGKYGPASSVKKENTQKLLDIYKRENNFIKELNGSFCIIVFDRGSISIYNDRMSSRPVWYNLDSSGFYAANIPSAVAVVKDRIPRLDKIGLWSFLATGRHTGELGLFEDIKILPSGSFLHADNDLKLRKSKWFELKYKPDYSYSIKDWGKKISAELQASAGRILLQYPQTNLFLSGGMDSRVAAAAFGDRSKSLTITTRKNMNTRTAEKVAKACGSNHGIIYRSDSWYYSSFSPSALISSGNYKITHSHFVPIFGEDAGYFNQAFLLGDLLENFNKHYFKLPVSSLNIESFIKNFNKIYSYSVKDYNNFESLFKPGYGSELRMAWEEYAVEEAKKNQEVSEFKEDFADAYFRWQNNTVCPTYLMHESIRPFASVANLMFDNDLFATLLSIPHEIKSSGKLHNEILRNLNPKLLWIPNSNFWLPPIAPAFLNNYAKKIRPHIGKFRRSLVSKFQSKPKPQTQPYPHSQPQPLILTEGSWDMLHERYRKDSKYKGLLEDLLFDESIFTDDFFDKDYIRKIWVGFNAGDKSLLNEIDHLFSFALLQRNIQKF